MSQKGFSIIELVTILLIVSMLATLSIAMGRVFLSKNRTVSAVNTFVSGLYYARLEAIQRGERVAVCGSRDGKVCADHWSDGQIVRSADGAVLRVLSALPTTDQLIWRGGFGRNDALEWLPTGYTNGQRGSFYYCAYQSLEASRVIVVLNTGRLYVSEMEATDYAKICHAQA